MTSILQDTLQKIVAKGRLKGEVSSFDLLFRCDLLNRYTHDRGVRRSNHLVALRPTRVNSANWGIFISSVTSIR